MERRTFSLTQAIKYGFTTFYHSLALLLGLSVINTFIFYVLPYLTIQQCDPSLMTGWNDIQARAMAGLATAADYKILFSTHAPFIIIFSLIYLIAASMLCGGIVQMYFDIVDTGSTHLSRLFSWASRTHRILAFFAAYPLLITVYFALAIGISNAMTSLLPHPLNLLRYALSICSVFFFGFYLVPRFVLSTYAFVDRQRGVYDAFSHSWHITAGNVLKIWGLLLIAGLLMFLPSLLLNIVLKVPYIYQFFAQISGIIMGLSITYAYRQLSPEEEIEIF